MTIVDPILLKRALQPHVPLIRFTGALQAIEMNSQRPEGKIDHVKQLFGSLSKKLWYEDRQFRPVLSDNEIEAINVRDKFPSHHHASHLAWWKILNASSSQYISIVCK